MGRLIVPFLILLAPSLALAIPIWPPLETKEFVEKTKEIVVARCLNPDVLGENSPKDDGLTLIEGEVLSVIKGERKLGKAKLATIGQPMEKGKRYLLGSFGGKVFDTDFLAQGEQCVVEVPADFDLKSLDGKAPQEKTQAIFDARRFQLDSMLRKLLREKEALGPTAPKGL